MNAPEDQCYVYLRRPADPPAPRGAVAPPDAAATAAPAGGGRLDGSAPSSSRPNDASTAGPKSFDSQSQPAGDGAASGERRGETDDDWQVVDKPPLEEDMNELVRPDRS